MTEQPLLLPNPKDEYYLINADEMYQIIGMVQDDDVNWSKRIIEILEEDVCSRPYTPPVAQQAPGELIYSSAPWKIYEQDAGMNEHDYAVMMNDVFFCRTEHSQTAHEIIRAIRFAANWKNGEAHDAALIKQGYEQAAREEREHISNEVKRILREHPARTVNSFFLKELEESLRSSAPQEPRKEKHVGHLSDAGVNPVIINDTYREKRK